MEQDARDRRKATAAAGFTGDRATAAAGIDDLDPRVRAAALRSCDRLELLTADMLAAALRDSHPHVRMAALELAASRTSPSVGALLDDDDVRVVEQAAWACGERPHDSAVTARLIDLAQTHDDPLVREASVAALGAIGNDRALEVSPMHRMLVSDWRVELMTGEAQALVPARDLVNGRDIERRTGGWVTYAHLLFDQHQIVFAEGAPSESLHPGVCALDALEQEARAEVIALFPDLANDVESYGPAAATVVKGYQATCISRLAG